jgi:uncharacterized protein (DUF433 family)
MKKKYIVSDPHILGGMPVITGTRVPVAKVLYLFKEGETLESIQEHFPHVSLDVLQAVIEEVASTFESAHHDTKAL